ncbi:MAG: Ig-like domain repeat protein [Acidobacteria bacterium]|nr:Ig-like domain repeat protein [Acidobacteriota bacterium]
MRILKAAILVGIVVCLAGLRLSLIAQDKFATRTNVSTSNSRNYSDESPLITANVNYADNRTGDPQSDVSNGKMNGTIIFDVDGKDFATVASSTRCVSNGCWGVIAKAQLPKGLSVGDHVVKATYSGAKAYQGSTGSVTQHTLAR